MLIQKIFNFHFKNLIKVFTLLINYGFLLESFIALLAYLMEDGVTEVLFVLDFNKAFNLSKLVN